MAKIVCSKHVSERWCVTKLRVCVIKLDVTKVRVKIVYDNEVC